MKTFPQIEDMLNFVYVGSQAFVSAELPVYGNPDREGGAHAPLSYNGNPMPQQGSMAGGALTDYEILGVVCHVRYGIGGTDAASEEWAAEFEQWCSPESAIFSALESGTSNYDTLHEDFAALMPAPMQVGTTARARSVAPPVAAHRSASDACAPRRQQGLRHGQVVRCGLCSVAGHTHTPAHAGTSNAALALRLRCSTMLVRARSATLPKRTWLEGVGRL
jgi:hypothetical protein